jgi:arylsulfatase A-like enzyme
VRGVAACLALGLASGCGGAPPSPNLLLVSVDTLRADRLACYGGPSDVGVELCALAGRGVRYAWAFSAAPSTAPSIASLLTARYPRSHGVSQHARSVLRDGIPTLAESLRAAGYTTAAFVANPVLERGKRLDRGFDVYDDRMPRRERNRPGYRERSARDTTDAALAWAETAREPWFVWVHYQDPHGPYDPPGAPPVRDPPAGERLARLDDDSGAGGIPAYQALPGVRTREAYEARYLAEIRYVDRELGRLVRALDARGRAPVVVATADHGEAFGEDGFFFAHGHSVGIDQIRVPLVVRPAEPGPARVVATPVSLVGVAPTLLRAADASIALAGAEGRPLPGLAAGAEPGAGDPVFAEHGRQVAVVQAGRYFARDRSPGASAGPDGKPWGRKSPALPARRASLPETGIPDGYEVAPAPEADGPLEGLLTGFLGRGSLGPVYRGEVPEATRARLRALGYEE